MNLSKRFKDIAIHNRRVQLGAFVTLLMATAVLARSEQVRDVFRPIAPITPAVIAAPATTPRIEAVFVLDTTGSMGGLIDGAKRKIWSIANQLASAKQTPDVRMGLIGYRDRGDDYVTRDYPLSSDIDALYGKLQQFQAQGGGDQDRDRHAAPVP